MASVIPTPSPLSHAASGCQLKITNGDGNVIATFRLNTLSYWEYAGNTGFTDGIIYRSFTAAQMTEMSLTTGTVDGYIATCDALGTGGAGQLIDLTDVTDATATLGNVLVADGANFAARPLVEADISDLGSYSPVAHTHTLADITDSGTLAGLNTVDTAQIADNAVTTAKINPTGVVAGSYTNPQITVNAEGQVTGISDGTSGCIPESVTVSSNIVETSPFTVVGVNAAGELVNANAATVPATVALEYDDPNWCRLAPGDRVTLTPTPVGGAGTEHDQGSILTGNGGLIGIVVSADGYTSTGDSSFNPTEDPELDTLLGRTIYLNDFGRFDAVPGKNVIPVFSVISDNEVQVLDLRESSPRTYVDELEAHWIMGRGGTRDDLTDVMDISGNGNDAVFTRGGTDESYPADGLYTRFGENGTYATATVDWLNSGAVDDSFTISGLCARQSIDGDSQSVVAYHLALGQIGFDVMFLSTGALRFTVYSSTGIPTSITTTRTWTSTDEPVMFTARFDGQAGEIKLRVNGIDETPVAATEVRRPPGCLIQFGRALEATTFQISDMDLRDVRLFRNSISDERVDRLERQMALYNDPAILETLEANGVLTLVGSGDVQRDSRYLVHATSVLEEGNAMFLRGTWNLDQTSWIRESVEVEGPAIINTAADVFHVYPEGGTLEVDETTSQGELIDNTLQAGDRSIDSLPSSPLPVGSWLKVFGAFDERAGGNDQSRRCAYGQPFKVRTDNTTFIDFAQGAVEDIKNTSSRFGVPVGTDVEINTYETAIDTIIVRTTESGVVTETIDNGGSGYTLAQLSTLETDLNSVYGSSATVDSSTLSNGAVQISFENLDGTIDGVYVDSTVKLQARYVPLLENVTISQLTVNRVSGESYIAKAGDLQNFNLHDCVTDKVGLVSLSSCYESSVYNNVATINEEADISGVFINDSCGAVSVFENVIVGGDFCIAARGYTGWCPGVECEVYSNRVSGARSVPILVDAMGGVDVRRNIVGSQDNVNRGSILSAGPRTTISRNIIDCNNSATTDAAIRLFGGPVLVAGNMIRSQCNGVQVTTGSSNAEGAINIEKNNLLHTSTSKTGFHGILFLGDDFAGATVSFNHVDGFDVALYEYDDDLNYWWNNTCRQCNSIGDFDQGGTHDAPHWVNNIDETGTLP